MIQQIRRIFVEKKEGFNIEAESLLKDLRENLGIKSLIKLRILYRYDIADISDEVFEMAKNTIFSEPPVDNVYLEKVDFSEKEIVYGVEFLPGQFDQRADSAAQAVQILTHSDKPLLKYAKIISLSGNLLPEETDKIKKYTINPVEAREASLKKTDTLEDTLNIPENVETINKFIEMKDSELESLLKELAFAMDLDDIKFCQNYFRETEKRNPTLTELRILDTYWSDHCRHTTFLTRIENAEFSDGEYSKFIEKIYNEYLDSKKYVYGDKKKDVCLMDIATIAMKELKKKGILDNLDESEEINACSIEVDADVNGQTEKWLVMFKNETHNHPTEIEPFGGAATCLGGAIRDPLSGRSYVYQAMRVTGSGDPRTKVEDTIEGKLPQRKISIGAAHGYSSYGNQIGLATGQVTEIYDEGYVAKRMEIGAVIGAAPKNYVVRMIPEPGDIVILLGGRTGRDGCGGATGSSKAHTEESLVTCGAEVQKGNPPEERKIQRLFRKKEVTRLIKRCNDFGAGGVSVAIGELADGLKINLDLIPKKYEGLDGTELAISESQERMAVVVSRKDAETFMKEAGIENLESTIVAEITEEKRMQMFWKGDKIVDISREFLNSNGAPKSADIKVCEPLNNNPLNYKSENIEITEKWYKTLSKLNVASQKGLVERFDGSIGAGSVFMPFGGKYQLSPMEIMAAKLPVLEGDTNTGTIMSYGYNPDISRWSPFHGAVYAIVESVSKIVAAGGDAGRIRLTLQEYFERLGKEPERWGKPFSALLGAYYAQKKLGIPAIGGKDSMSGTFKDLDVPPTLVSFAVDTADVRKLVSTEFKKASGKVIKVDIKADNYFLPDFDDLKKKYAAVKDLISRGKVLSSSIIKANGLAETISKMCFGNMLGFKFSDNVEVKELFASSYGSIILEVVNPEEIKNLEFNIIGEVTEEAKIVYKNSVIDLKEALNKWSSVLEDIFPTKTSEEKNIPQNYRFNSLKKIKSPVKIAKPRVTITTFPGNNCEYDTARAFSEAGAVADTFIFRNLTSQWIDESVKEMVDKINNSQIIMIPGGFSAGDEPEGSGKFIATVFRNPAVSEAVMNLLYKRDGLMLGICNGFQALIKLGILPYGEIRDILPEDPTLTFNKINRHVSCLIRTKIVSNLSPWLYGADMDETYMIAVSHGEGRFAAGDDVIAGLMKNGQVATQYVDFEGKPSGETMFNPNGSYAAIEGITSPDGRVLGKMAHNERFGKNTFRNIPGEKDHKLFISGVEYFS
ncbi:MAG: phosphoribosylformylglycinamidine synthase [Ignavibacteria bacterium]|nr:phosphoribosylformylglycinamidine synthase [Ignavibacteria bacterium]